MRSLENVEAVDLAADAPAHADRGGFFEDGADELLAAAGREELGVVDPPHPGGSRGGDQGRRKEDGGGDDGAAEGPAPDFIHAGDGRASALQMRTLDGEIRHGGAVRRPGLSAGRRAGGPPCP